MVLDNNTFETLFYEYGDRLRNYASMYMSDSYMTGDVVQEAFVRLWEKYEGKDSEYWHPLLFKMVRNRCLDHLRHLTFMGSRACVLPQNSNEDRLYALDFRTDDRSIYDDLNAEVRRILDLLPEKCREVFVLSRFHDMKNREIAGALGISEKTVEKHISKALRLFREQLNRNGHLDPVILILLMLS